MAPERLKISLAKAEYLLNSTASPGKGGDKRKFWREILGFSSAEAIRESLLAQVTLNSLKAVKPNEYGQRYQAIISIIGPSGRTRLVKTVWIVLTGESTAQLVTVTPERYQRLS